MPFLSEGPILGTGSVDKVHVASSRINSDQPTADGFVPGITLKVVRNLRTRSEASHTLTISSFYVNRTDVRTAGGNVWHPPIGAWTIQTLRKKRRLGMVFVKRVGCLKGVHVC